MVLTDKKETQELSLLSFFFMTSESGMKERHMTRKGRERRKPSTDEMRSKRQEEKEVTETTVTNKVAFVS